jgi:hypothetical protein
MPNLQLFGCVCKGHEPVGVQAFCPEHSIEGEDGLAFDPAYRTYRFSETASVIAILEWRVSSMIEDRPEIRRKLRILGHVAMSGDVSKTYRYFGMGRTRFYRWRQAWQDHGEAGLANRRSVPHSHPHKTPEAVPNRFCICARNTISGRSGSSGMGPKTRMQSFTASSSTMA